MVYGERDAGGDWRVTGAISSCYGFEMQWDDIDGQFYADRLGRTIEEFASHIRVRNDDGQEINWAVIAGASYLSISANRIYVTLVSSNSFVRFADGNRIYIKHDSGLINETAVKFS